MPRLLIPLLLLTACYADELRQEMEQEPFFDLSGYIDAQVDSLQRLRPTVEKTIVLNGTSETKRLTDINFATDLRVLREADINKPAWLDKYRVDTRREGAATVTVYTATDTTMQTRVLTVTREGGIPTDVEVSRKTGTVLSQGAHTLTYRPASGYRLQTMQVNRFGDDLDADIRVSW